MIGGCGAAHGDSIHGAAASICIHSPSGSQGVFVIFPVSTKSTAWGRADAHRGTRLSGWPVT
eukprot:873527-Prymnesium_polylepis.2